ncbi:uncharacterized protein LOC112271682 [Brachypodium distachyon]|uniref:uncharacterized protein LOC112271682 n=1 Tax=Brachypodium distachyon TaxID=15368 RepID=UPI000D0DD937|nr:uncharacterized protein LOC112271682 [Brachypodium distachyon]|eukprot:XP_024317198.1 uncharacterized protein LOC112271682 [Brachypodium distachyon]
MADENPKPSRMSRSRSGRSNSCSSSSSPLNGAAAAAASSFLGGAGAGAGASSSSSPPTTPSSSDGEGEEVVKAAANAAAAWTSLGAGDAARGRSLARSGKLRAARAGPLMASAAASWARAAMSAVGKVPSQMRDFFRGSRISDTHFPHARIRTPRYVGCFPSLLRFRFFFLASPSSIISISISASSRFFPAAGAVALAAGDEGEEDESVTVDAHDAVELVVYDVDEEEEEVSWSSRGAMAGCVQRVPRRGGGRRSMGCCCSAP